MTDLPESREARHWALFALAAVPVLVFIVLNAFWYIEGIERFNSFTARADIAPPPEVSVREHPRRLFLDADSYLWNLYAGEVARGRAWRVRRTSFDNHPRGREVHWASAYTWLLAAAGRLWSAASGTELTASVERASRFLNPLLHLVFVVFSSLLAARRFHPLAGVFLLISLTASNNLLRSFFPGYPDHHGLASMAIFGTIFPLLAGGAGLVRGGQEAERAARRWFTASAAAAAVGLWVSGITFGIVLLSVGTGAVAAMLVSSGGDPSETRFVPGLWRRWGISGAAIGFALYLLEYFPSHLGLRLEVNHPLYHLGWVGGAFLISYAGEKILGRRSLKARDRWGAVASLAAIAALPLAIWIGGAGVYGLRDPFLLRLSLQIMEFQRYPPRDFLIAFGPFLAIWALAALLLGRRGLGVEQRFPGAFALLFCLVPLGMTLWQRRWGTILACGLALSPMVVLILSSDGPKKSLLRRLAAGAVLMALTAHFIAFALPHIKEAKLLREGRADHLILSSFAAAWDAAGFLRRSEGDRPIVLASTPWPTTVMSYAGGFRGIGSLYWENLDGLEAAVDLFTAESDDEALRIVRERGITHVAMVATDFSMANLMYLRSGNRDESRIAHTLGRRIFRGPRPWWLSPLNYVPRNPLFRDNPAFFGVYLFRVDPRVLS